MKGTEATTIGTKSKNKYGFSVKTLLIDMHRGCSILGRARKMYTPSMPFFGYFCTSGNQ
jgi:hypothetical protein